MILIDGIAIPGSGITIPKVGNAILTFGITIPKLRTAVPNAWIAIAKGRIVHPDTRIPPYDATFEAPNTKLHSTVVTALLHIRDLFADAFEFVFQFDHIAGDREVVGFATHRVNLAAHLLKNELRLAADLARTFQ